ncbi:MAG: pyruvate dehydrogenase [Bergeyella sp.]|nr:pyruvate dehydrogenase [Bergeyella sp.]
MAEVITMPRLSDTMIEGKVAKWHKKVGDEIKEGDIIAEIETDKAVQDFESEVEGTLLYVGVAEGAQAPVDGVLAVIGAKGEDVTALISSQGRVVLGEKAEFASRGEKKEVREEPHSAEIGLTVTEIPEGVEVVNMPRLSDTMAEGKVAKWHKKVGDEIKEGDIIAEIETDKAVQDFESEYQGFLLYQGVAEGSSVPVDAVLAVIGPEGTDVSFIASGGRNSPAGGIPKKESQNFAVRSSQNIQEQAVNEDLIERIAISPLARKMAQERGIALTSLRGSGENGRIIKKDIESYKGTVFSESDSAVPAEKVSVAAKAPAVTPLSETTETPNSQMRLVIAKRLSESKFTAPHYYLMVEINMDKAMEAREEMNALPDTKVSFNDMIVKACAVALRKHPQVNSSWRTDKIVHHGDINIGVAVAVPDGLVVPVLKNADFLNYNQISAQVKDMAARAKTKALKANEMEGSTFSISNLGMFGIEVFTSIVNQPNSAILSVGTIVEKPIVKEGQIVVGNTMKVSLACDHRVIDGATGAEFLQTVRTYLEQPLTLLL